jgi:hypothetical protein
MKFAHGEDGRYDYIGSLMFDEVACAGHRARPRLEVKRPMLKNRCTLKLNAATGAVWKIELALAQTPTEAVTQAASRITAQHAP